MSEVAAPIVGNVWKVLVQAGDVVESGVTLVVLETMKMEIPVKAPRGGRVAQVCVTPGVLVQEGEPVAVLEDAG